MYFETLFRINTPNSKEKPFYELYFVVKAENKAKATELARSLASAYFTDEGPGIQLGDLKFEYPDNCIVEVINIKRTTLPKFVEERTEDLFLINNILINRRIKYYQEKRMNHLYT